MLLIKINLSLLCTNLGGFLYEKKEKDSCDR